MIRVYPDKEALSQAAADIFVTKAQQAIAQSGLFSICLSGGNTPQHVYQLLGETPRQGLVKWESVHVFWGDERCVPENDPRNNARMARQAFLDHVPIPPGQIHAILCEQDPRQAAEQYEHLVRNFFAGQQPGFDLVYLGLGQDGHTASLFPNQFTQDRRWVVEASLAGQDFQRVTMTPELLNQARMIVFLVSGTDKAQVFKEVVQGPKDEKRLPAQLIQPENGELFWLVDQDAASKLAN